MGEGVPGLVEVGQQASDFGLVDLINCQIRQLVVDLGQAAFGDADSFLQVGELGDSRRCSEGGGAATGVGWSCGPQRRDTDRFLQDTLNSCEMEELDCGIGRTLLGEQQPLGVEYSGLAMVR